MKKYDNDYLLLFSLPSCPQCKGLAQSLQKTGLEYEKSEEYEKYNVEEVPTLILMSAHKGHIHKEEKRHIGFMTEDELNEFVKGTSCTRWLKKQKPTLFDAYQHHNWRESKTCGTLTTAGSSVRGDTPLVVYDEE